MGGEMGRNWDEEEERKLYSQNLLYVKKIYFNKGKKYVCNYGEEYDVLLYMNIAK